MGIRACVVATTIFAAAFQGTVMANDCVFADGFESCPKADSEQIAALEARVAELERLLSEVQRGVNPDTGGDELTLPATVLVEQLQISGLSAGTTSSNPICRDASGNVSPCSSNAPLPPDSLIGEWVGSLAPDPTYAGPDECFTDEIRFLIGEGSSGADGRILSITTIRPGTGLDIYSITDGRIFGGVFSRAFIAFGESISFNVIFDAAGFAQGNWVKGPADGGCYGTFELVRQ